MLTNDKRKRAAGLWVGAGLVAVLWVGAVPAQGAAKQVKKVAPANFSGVWALSPKQGRTYDPDAGLKQQPPLKPEWKEQWDKTRARQVAGMRVWDPLSRCLPPGMPRTMSGSYPMEILMTPGRVTVLTELYNETRRIWTDGRGHPPPDELEYTFVGDSVGHWEGDTLVVDTVGVREESVLDVMFIPHSDQAHFTEHAHLKNKDELDWTITMEDPVVYTRPWTVTRKFVRAPAGEGVREFVCAENNQPDKYLDSPEDAFYEHPDPRLRTRE